MSIDDTDGLRIEAPRPLAPVLALRPIEADPYVVEMLERVLARARAGEVRAVAIAVETTDRGTGGGFTLGTTGDIAHLITGMERMKLRLLNEGGDQ